MTNGFPAPMLAATELPSEAYLNNLFDRGFGPVLVTPKWDGIRALTGFGTVVSRRLKPIRNVYIREILSDLFGKQPLDGEIVCYGSDGVMFDFNTTQSLVMSYSGRPTFRFHIFDTWDVADDYQGRIGWLLRNVTCVSDFHTLAEPEWVFDRESLHAVNDRHLAAGYEGSCGRLRTGPYKRGRATLTEGWLFKLKPFMDEEAFVIGHTPLYRNVNGQTVNALGLTERSKHMAGLVLDESRFGALICHNDRWGTFLVGSGFTDLQRCNPQWFYHRYITYKYQPNHSRDKPHAATFKAIREDHELNIREETTQTGPDSLGA